MERINHNLTASLLEVNALLAMCDLEQRLAAVEHYDDVCVKMVRTDDCCRPWSLPNYVALLANRTHCFDITAEDVARVQKMLQHCFKYYDNLKLQSDCVSVRCRNVPAQCARFNAVYNVFHFLVDNQAMSVNVSSRVVG